MKRRTGLLSMALVVLVGLGVSLCPGAASNQGGTTREGPAAPKPAEKRERAMDRVVHIEEGIIREIPAVPRLCDVLDLRKEKVDIGDCKLCCEQEGQGTPVVLLHGGPGATHHEFHPWFSQAKDFARVIYYDQRGCGLSDYEPGKGYSVDQAVEDLDRLRQALGIDQWVVLGHSYGGLLAQCYAIKYPENVKGLILLCASTGLHGESLPSRQNDFISPEEHQKMNQIRKTPGLTIPQLVYNNFLNGDWKRQNYYKPTREEIARMALYGWVHDFDRNFNGVMSNSANAVDLEGAFPQCPVPTLILEAKWDTSWNTDKPERFRKNHRNAKLIMFEASGHSPFEDEPDKFFGVLKDFLTALPPVPADELKQWKDGVAKWQQRKRAVHSAFLQTTASPRECEMVRSLEEAKGEALRGREFRDLSTPANTFLTLVSAIHHQDRSILLQALPVAGQHPQLLSPEFRTKLLEGLGKTTVCRIEVEDRPPQESDVAAIYTTDSPEKKIDQVFMFGYTQGAWRFLGSDSGLVNNWKPFAEAAEKQTRALLQQQTPKSP
jgi:proline iminopeptidase